MKSDLTFGEGKYRSRVLGVKTKEYNAWRDMIKRVYSEAYKKRFPAYKDCTLCEEWHNFQVFAEWYVNQPQYGYGYELDKDIIGEGSKNYSPTSCALVPKQINYLLNSNRANRGEHKQGVIKNKNSGRFQAQIKIRGKNKSLGSYLLEEDAFQAYKKEKESYVKSVCLEWKDNLDKRVFDKLMNWELINEK